MGRDPLFFLTKCSGDIIISYAKDNEYFCTRMEFTKMFVISLDFADTKTNKNIPKGMTYRIEEVFD